MRLLTTTLILSVVFLFGCKKDTVVYTESQIHGTWNFVSSTSDNYKSTTTYPDGTKSIIDLTFFIENIDRTFTFKEDYTQIIQGGTKIFSEITDNVTGKTNQDTTIIASTFYKGSWSLENNNLILRDSQGRTTTSMITKLTAKELEYTQEADFTIEQNESTQQTTGTVYVKLAR